MELDFYKYQGAGNDFIIVDNRDNTFDGNKKDVILNLCDRHFGIGADGLILLENDKKAAFKMVYFNADGNQSTMCGNGGRCVVAFAKKLGLVKTEQTNFTAIDGLHYALIKDNHICLQMKNVSDIKVKDDYIFVDTGSPHHIKLEDDIDDFPVFSEGRRIRNELYGKQGSNVNFVQKVDNSTFKIRTYERGVENETLACGTGATAVAIAMNYIGQTQLDDIKIITKASELEVSFERENSNYKNVFLKGEATFVFSGKIKI